LTTPSAKKRGTPQRGPWQGWQRGQRDDLTLSEARHILWERRIVVAGCTLFFIGLALLYGFTREPVYTAGATLSLNSEGGLGGAGSLDEILSGLQNSTDKPGLIEEAAENAGWKNDPNGFRDRLKVEAVNSEEVEVRFSDSTPEGAARAANAYAGAFVQRLKGLDSRLAGGSVAAEASIKKAAEPPDKRSGPGVLLVAAGAGVVGLLVGGVVALFLEGRARRWSGASDAELTLRAPVLGVIPDYSSELSEVSSSLDGGAG
jgi:uncharacterized protein involved in exopolysaccharide biosynthesis